MREQTGAAVACNDRTISTNYENVRFVSRARWAASVLKIVAQAEIWGIQKRGLIVHRPHDIYSLGNARHVESITVVKLNVWKRINAAAVVIEIQYDAPTWGNLA